MKNLFNYIKTLVLCALLLLAVFTFGVFAQSKAADNSAKAVEPEAIANATNEDNFSLRYFKKPQRNIKPNAIYERFVEKSTAADTIDAAKVAKDEAADYVAPKNLKQAENTGKWKLPDGAREIGVELGVAPDIATWMSGPKYYDINNRGQIAGSFRWGKVLGTRGWVQYTWAVEVLPFTIALNNEVDNPKYVAGAENTEPRRNREATYGIGIDPANFRFAFFPKYRLRPQIGAGFGVVRSVKRVPTVEGTKFNFQWTFQFGGQYMIKKNKAINFGYRYYHLSNMYLFNFNPGYNVNMYFVGYSIFK